MAHRVEVCFAPGKALSPAEAREFGSEIAEPPILLDYLSLTHGNFLGTKERDWWDEGPLATRVKNHIEILDKRHKLTQASKTALLASQVPDISTFQGIDAAALKLAKVNSQSARMVGVPGMLGMVKALKGNRNEFYEIKPRNIKGQADGREKIDNIRGIYAACGLPYLAGTTYPDAFYDKGIAEIPLLMRSEGQKKQWFSAVKVAMARNGLSRVELYLSVSRKGVMNGGRMPHGLLLYKICVATEAQEEKEDQVAIRLARELVHTWIICLTAGLPEPLPSKIRETWLTFEADAITRGVGPTREIEPVAATSTPNFPLINLSFAEIYPPLRGTDTAMREALISRGIGVPGDEYLVCCDGTYFSTLATDMLPAVHMMTVLQKTPLRWYGYVKDRGALGVMDMVIEVNSLVGQVAELGLAVWTDFVEWGKQNPGKRTVVILVVIVVAAATIYVAAPLVAAELGMGAVATGTATELTVTAGSRVAVGAATRNTAVQIAIRQEIMREALLQEAAQSTLQREVIKQGVQQIVRTTAVSADTVALKAAIVGQAGTVIGRQAVSQLIVKAPAILAAGAGVTIFLSGKVAYGAERQNIPITEAKGDLIGVQVGRMFLLKADLGSQQVPPMLKPIVTGERAPPQLGKEFDASRFSSEAAKAAKPEDPAGFKCYYLGKVKLS